jgi:hypothetical protein
MQGNATLATPGFPRWPTPETPQGGWSCVSWQSPDQGFSEHGDRRASQDEPLECIRSSPSAAIGCRPKSSTKRDILSARFGYALASGQGRSLGRDTLVIETGSIHGAGHSASQTASSPVPQPMSMTRPRISSPASANARCGRPIAAATRAPRRREPLDDEAHRVGHLPDAECRHHARGQHGIFSFG